VLVRMREDGTRGGGFESGASFWSGKNVLAVYSVLVSFFFFWFWGLNSGLHTLGQLLYCLSHTSNPLAVYFEPVSCLTGGHGGGVAGGRSHLLR
jgi:hypothetical protein